MQQSKKITLRCILLVLISALLIVGCSAQQEIRVGETASENVQNEGSPSESEAVSQIESTENPTSEPTVQPTDPPPTDTPLSEATPTNTPKIEKVYVLPDLGVAPDITNEVWLNAEPHTLEDLRGKVVLVEFWTFG